MPNYYPSDYDLYYGRPEEPPSVPNLVGATNASLADTRKKYAGANGRLDPNAITQDTLTGYGVPKEAAEDASPYLATSRLHHDLDQSALAPQKHDWTDYLGAALQLGGGVAGYAQGNKQFGAYALNNNIATRDADMKDKLRQAGIESTMKNASELTGNVDKVIAEQQADRTRARRAKAAGFTPGTPQYQQYIATGQWSPSSEMTDDLKEYQAAKAQGYAGTVMDFLAQKKGAGSALPSYQWNADHTAQIPVPGGAADPKTVSTLSEARGRGGQNVPQTVRTQAISANQAYHQLVPMLDEYADMIDGKQTPGPDGKMQSPGLFDYGKNSGTGAVGVPGADTDKVLQARRGIQLQLKELFNLGVLNGPDLSLMDTMLFDPSVSLDPRTWSQGMNTGSRARQSVTKLKEVLRKIRNAKTNIIGLPDVDENGNTIAGSDAAQSGATSTANLPDPLGIR